MGLLWGADPWIFFSMIGLTLFGSLMVVSTAQGVSVGTMNVLLSSLLHQVAYVAAAYVAMIFADHATRLGNVRSPVKNRFFRFGVWVLCLAYLGVMVVTALVGVEANGSRAWLGIPGLGTVQPSEFGKPLIILVFAMAVYQSKLHPEYRQSYWRLFRWPILFTLASMAALVLQHDFGTLIIQFVIAFACSMIPGYPGLAKTQNRLMIAAMIMVIIGLVVIFTPGASDFLTKVPGMSHIATRINNMKNPYQDVYGEGYQPANSLYGIADAGLFGKGLGNSARKYGYLTQAESDYILAVTVEELGIIGLGIISAGYGIIVWRLMKWLRQTDSIPNKVIFAGTMTYLLGQMVINVGGVGALIPMTGVPLLFISSGGSSLLSIYITLGMCQNRISEIRDAGYLQNLKKLRQPEE